MFKTLTFKRLRRAFVSVFAATASLAAGITIAVAAPTNEYTLAAGGTTEQSNGPIIAVILLFALGWVVVELRRASRS